MLFLRHVNSSEEEKDLPGLKRARSDEVVCDSVRGPDDSIPHRPLPFGLEQRPPSRQHFGGSHRQRHWGQVSLHDSI